MQYITQYFEALWQLSAEMAPYLLLGLLVAGLLKVYFPQDKMVHYLGGRNLRSVINASLFGIPLPLCSCGVIPTGVSFYRNGASKGSTISFLISTPQTGVDSIMATYALLGWPLAIIRPIVALITGVVGGWLSNKLDDDETIPTTQLQTNSDDTHTNRFVAMLRYAFFDFLQDIMQWLLIGLLVAAAISVAVPDTFFTEYIGNGFVGMLIMLVAAIPLYVCATASVPIAAVLLMKGLAPGAVLVFLMAGPATNAATIAVLSNALGRKTFWIYLLTIIAGSFIFGTIINEFLPAEWFQVVGTNVGHIHEHTTLIGVISAVVLGILIGFAYFKKFTYKPEKTELMDNQIEISVAGMECKHCKANVEKNLTNLDGIDEVLADIQKETVVIKGDANLQVIEETVNGLGYKYGGIVHNLPQ